MKAAASSCGRHGQGTRRGPAAGFDQQDPVAEYERKIGEIALDLMGPEAFVAGEDYDPHPWQATFLQTRTHTISAADPAQHHRRARSASRRAERMSAVTEEREELVRGVRDMLAKRALAKTRGAGVRHPYDATRGA
jgi:hypothetical protein